MSILFDVPRVTSGGVRTYWAEFSEWLRACAAFCAARTVMRLENAQKHDIHICEEHMNELEQLELALRKMPDDTQQCIRLTFSTLYLKRFRAALESAKPKFSAHPLAFLLVIRSILLLGRPSRSPPLRLFLKDSASSVLLTQILVGGLLATKNTLFGAIAGTLTEYLAFGTPLPVASGGDGLSPLSRDFREWLADEIETFIERNDRFLFLRKEDRSAVMDLLRSLKGIDATYRMNLDTQN